MSDKERPVLTLHQGGGEASPIRQAIEELRRDYEITLEHHELWARLHHDVFRIYQRMGFSREEALRLTISSTTEVVS